MVLYIEANDRLYLEEKERTIQTNNSQNYLIVIQKDKVFIHAHLGATDIDEIFSKLRYMIVGCECELGNSRSLTYVSESAYRIR